MFHVRQTSAISERSIDNFIIIGANVSALSFSILVGTGSSAQEVLEVECRMICLMSATVDSVNWYRVSSP